MQQMVNSARRAATRALESGEQKERAFRKPLVCGKGRIEKEQKDSPSHQPQPYGAGNDELARSISGDVHEMKVCHDTGISLIDLLVLSQVDVGDFMLLSMKFDA